MKYFTFIVALSVCLTVKAQHKLSLQAGWTISNFRSVYDKNTVQGPAFDAFSTFKALHYPHVGLEYAYSYGKTQWSTGIAMMAFGSGSTPLFGDVPWPNYYIVVPLLGGYRFDGGNHWSILLEGGVDMGYQIANTGIINNGAKRFNLNAVLGAEIGWKRFQIGIRGHWGVTNFRVWPPIIYRHTALTTYLSYTLWDQQKAKANRLRKRQQEKWTP